jgi:hypothetical protein
MPGWQIALIRRGGTDRCRGRGGGGPRMGRPPQDDHSGRLTPCPAGKAVPPAIKPGPPAPRQASWNHHDKSTCPASAERREQANPTLVISVEVSDAAAALLVIWQNRGLGLVTTAWLGSA